MECDIILENKRYGGSMMQEGIALSKQDLFSNEISTIQIVPMYSHQINCSTIDEAQNKFFINTLLERKDCYYRLDGLSVKLERDKLLLFQFKRHIIACAKLKKITKPNKVDKYSKKVSFLLLYPESVQVFKPIHKHELMKIRHRIKEPDNRAFKIEDEREIQTILQLIEQNTSEFTLSIKCLKKGLDIAETCSKNKSIEELVALSESNFSINRKYTTETTIYNRNPYLKSLIKKLAQGECQLCEKSAPFLDSQEEPYLEVHHVTRLANGGR